MSWEAKKRPDFRCREYFVTCDAATKVELPGDQEFRHLVAHFVAHFVDPSDFQIDKVGD